MTLKDKANNRSQYRSFLHLESCKFCHHRHLLKLQCHQEATHCGCSIFMAFLGDLYGFSPTTQCNFYYAPPSLQPQTQDLGPPNQGVFNPFNSIPPMDMNDHLNMEKDLKLFVYPSKKGFKIPREDNNVAYFVKNLYQSSYPHTLSKFAINVLKFYFGCSF